MKRQRWLEWVLQITSWITIAGTVVWVAILPWTCNYAVFFKRYYTIAPWAEALAEPEFWRMLAFSLLPAAAVLLVMSQGLRVLSHVRRGALFCRPNIQAFRIVGGVGLLAAAGTLVSTALSLPLSLTDVGKGLFVFPNGTVVVLSMLLNDLVLFGFCLMGGLFCLLLAQFLRRGLELQEDNDLTI